MGTIGQLGDREVYVVFGSRRVRYLGRRGREDTKGRQRRVSFCPPGPTPVCRQVAEGKDTTGVEETIYRRPGRRENPVCRWFLTGVRVGTVESAGDPSSFAKVSYSLVSKEE